jgi:hypothetical protein
MQANIFNFAYREFFTAIRQFYYADYIPEPMQSSPRKYE